MWVIVGFLAVGVAALFAASMQRSTVQARMSGGDCPHCKVALVPIQPEASVQPPRAWEVLACPRCDLCSPVVQGLPSSAGWCPSCRQHALELTARRLEAAPLAPIRVEVSERCHLCTHNETLVVEHRHAPQKGKVIPFPGGRNSS